MLKCLPNVEKSTKILRVPSGGFLEVFTGLEMFLMVDQWLSSCRYQLLPLTVKQVRLLGQVFSEHPPGLKIHYFFGSLLWRHPLPLTEMYKKITISQLSAILCVRYLRCGY